MKMKEMNKYPTLIFLTGLGMDPNIGFSFLEKISPLSRIILPNYPNPLLIKGNSVDASLLAVADCLDKALPYDSVLIGWSLGGLIATVLNFISPNKYRKLITISSSPKFVSSVNWPGISKENIRKFQQLAQIDFDKLWRRFMALVLYPNIKLEQMKIVERKNVLTCSEFVFYLNILMKTDVRDLMPAVRDDSLHIYGDSDAIAPIEVGKFMLKTYVKTNVKTVKGAGHMPFYTHENEVVQMVRNFLI